MLLVRCLARCVVGIKKSLEEAPIINMFQATHAREDADRVADALGGEAVGGLVSLALGAAKGLECKALWRICLLDLPFQGYLEGTLVGKGGDSGRFTLWSLFWQEMNVQSRFCCCRLLHYPAGRNVKDCRAGPHAYHTSERGSGPKNRGSRCIRCRTERHRSGRS